MGKFVDCSLSVQGSVISGVKQQIHCAVVLPDARQLGSHTGFCLQLLLALLACIGTFSCNHYVLPKKGGLEGKKLEVLLHT